MRAEAEWHVGSGAMKKLLVLAVIVALGLVAAKRLREA